METEIRKLREMIKAVPKGTPSFDLIVADSMTLDGQSVPSDVGMAIILDDLLGKDLFPDGFDVLPGGRRYRYKKR